VGLLDTTRRTVNAPYAWSLGLDGAASVSDYRQRHLRAPDLNSAYGSRVVYRQSFIGGVKTDDYGHGTHVAGIVAGNGSVSAGPGGSTPIRDRANARLLDLRVLDANGVSSDSVIIAAIQRAVQLKQQYNVRVINLSVGRPVFEELQPGSAVPGGGSGVGKRHCGRGGRRQFGRNGYATVCPPQQPARHHRGCHEDDWIRTPARTMLSEL